MAYSAEHRAHCYQLASERRRRGLSSWAYTVDLKRITDRHTDDELSDEQLANVCTDIVKELKAKLPAKFFDLHDPDVDMSFLDVIDSLEQASVSDFAFDRENGYQPVELVDSLLSELYDWCDNNRVWIGG